MSNLPTRTTNYLLPLAAIGKISVRAALNAGFALVDTALKGLADAVAALQGAPAPSSALKIYNYGTIAGTLVLPDDCNVATFTPGSATPTVEMPANPTDGQVVILYLAAAQTFNPNLSASAGQTLDKGTSTTWAGGLGSYLHYIWNDTLNHWMALNSVAPA